VVDLEHADKALFPERVGDRLRVARVNAGLDLSDIAAKTRIPLRHLTAIEAGNYSSFPSSTYCVGFVKAYARTVGEDEVGLARALRSELGEVRPDPRTDFYDVEDADPARLPTTRLAWTAAAILILLVSAYWAFRQWQLADPRDTAPRVAAVTTLRPAQPLPLTTPTPVGRVVLTARDKVWVRIYDANDKVLLQRELAADESFAVPDNALNPQIRTDRPELISVTIDGREVAALGSPERMIKGVGISAAALTGRAVVPSASRPAASPPNTDRPTRQSQTPPVAAPPTPAPSAEAPGDEPSSATTP